jgi:hypothetical protein
MKHQLDSACLWIFRPVVRITTSTCTSLFVANIVILSHMIWVQPLSIETSPFRSQADLGMVWKLIGSVKMEAECSYPDQSSLRGGTAGRVVGQKLQLSAWKCESLDGLDFLKRNITCRSLLVQYYMFSSKERIFQNG